MENTELMNTETGAIESLLPRKSELAFRCPQCGGDEIVEVTEQRQKIRIYEDHDWVWEPVSDDLESHQAIRFQCSHCKYTLANDCGKYVETISEMVAWLLNSRGQGAHEQSTRQPQKSN